MAAASAFQPLLVQTLTHIRQRHSFSTTQLFRAKPRKSKTSSEFRADRVMANRTGEPRAHCFELLQKKRVFLKKEDDSFEVIPGPASRIPMNSPLFVDKRHPVPQPVTLLTVFHKPKWMLSVRADPQGRNCLGDLLLPKHPVGRLDYDSSGLLLFSSSGPLTQFLLHPKHGIEKEYVAICTGNIDGDYLHERLSQGVETAEGCYTADLLHVKHLDDVEDYLREVRESLPPEYNQTDLSRRGYLKVLEATELSLVRLVVTEGKHRMVRRILANCGHPVVDLERQRIGGICLEDLPPGESRELTFDETEWVAQVVNDMSPKKEKYVNKKTRMKYAAVNNKSDEENDDDEEEDGETAES